MATDVLTHMACCFISHLLNQLVQLVFTTKAVCKTYPKHYEPSNRSTCFVSYLPLNHIAGMVGDMGLSCDLCMAIV